MNYSSLISDITVAFPSLTLRENEPLSRHCSFHIGGPAALLLIPCSEEELEAVCTFLAWKGIEPFLIGNGTNLLIPDEGLDRVVVKTCQYAGGLAVQGTEVTAACGVSLSRAAVVAQAHGLTGLEFAHGIPGSVGGGVIMNAGAYGGELKDVVSTTEYLDENMIRCTIQGSAHKFSYRCSALSGRACVVLRVVFSLTKGEPTVISQRMQELGEKRRTSQPLEMPSAGSVFKRPTGGYAASLIEESGLKGCSIGGAQVSPKHAGFIVNTGNASYDDVLRLIEHIQSVVLARSGIRLEPEIRIVRR